MGKNAAIGIVIFALVLSATSVGVSTYLSAKDVMAIENQLSTKVDESAGDAKNVAVAASAAAVKVSADASQNLLPKVNGTATDLRADGSLWVAGRFLVTPAGDTDKVVFNIDGDAKKPSAKLSVPLTLTKALTAGDIDSKGTTTAKTFKTASGSFEVGDNGNAALDGDLTVKGKATARELVVTGDNLTIGSKVAFGNSSVRGDYALSVDGVVEAKNFFQTGVDQFTFTNGINVTGGKTATLTGLVESGNGNWQISSAGEGTFKSLTTDSLTANGTVLLKSGATVSGSKLTADDGLTVKNGSTTSGGATVNGTLRANDNAQVGGDLAVAGAIDASDITATSSLEVGSSAFTVSSTGNVAADGNLTVGGTGAFAGNFNVNSNRFVVNATSGNTTVLGTLSVAGNNFAVSSGGGLTASAADISGTLDVTGAMDITGAGTVGGLLTAQNGLAVTNGSVLGGGNTLSGGNTLNGGATVNGLLDANDNFTVDGNTTLAGTLDVTGLTSLGDLDVSGDAAVTGDVTATNITASGSISAANLKSGVLAATGQSTVQPVPGMPAGAVVVVTPRFAPTEVYWVTVSAGSFDLERPAGPADDGDFSWIATW